MSKVNDNILRKQQKKLTDAIYLTFHPNLYPYIYQTIGKYAYGMALERENRRIFNELKQKYTTAYRAIVKANQKEATQCFKPVKFPGELIILPIPMDLTYDVNINYKPLRTILHRNGWDLGLGYGGFHAQQLVHMVGRAKFWQELTSLNELLLNNDNTTIRMLRKRFNEEADNKITYNVIERHRYNLSLILSDDIDTKPIIAEFIAVTFDNSGIDVIIREPFEGTIYDLLDLVRQHKPDCNLLTIRNSENNQILWIQTHE